LKRIDIFLRNKVTTIPIIVYNLVNDVLGARNRLILVSGKILITIQKVLHFQPNNWILQTDVNTHKIGHNKVDAASILNSSANAHSLDYVGGSSTMILNDTTAGVYFEHFTDASNKAVLTSSQVGTNLRSSSQIKPRMTLASALGSNHWSVTKYPSIIHKNILRNGLRESAVMYLPKTGNDMVLINKPLGYIFTRYRLLDEMDNFPFSDFDGMTMENVDYITLE